MQFKKETIILKTSGWDQDNLKNQDTTLNTSQITQENQIQQKIQENSYLITDEQLNSLLPIEGYVIVEPPQNYTQFINSKQIQENSKFVDENQDGYIIPETQYQNEDVPAMTQNDLKYFGQIIQQKQNLTKEEEKEIQLIVLLLQIKNGNSEIRKKALQKITEKAKYFGVEQLLLKILPLLMDEQLDNFEKHFLVKTLERIMFELKEQIKPYCHKILTIASPMLNDEDFLIRIEGRELIANLAKTVGLSQFVLSIRTDIDNPLSEIRELTSQCFAIGSIALTIQKSLPFIQAVCRSKKSIFARHTGCKIIYYIAKMMGYGILPHLKQLIHAIQPCIKDEIKMVKISAGLSISALANSCKPHGLESFDIILKDLWETLIRSQGRLFASYLKAMGNIIPLMDDQHINDYNKLILRILLKEFQTPDDEMKKIILKVLNEIFLRQEVDKKFIKENIFEIFWENFWIKRLCIDRGGSFHLINTTANLTKIIGVQLVIKKLTFYLKEDDSSFRKVTMQTIKKIVQDQGLDEITKDYEELLVDASLFAFHQQQNDEDDSVLEGLASVLNNLKIRAQKYLGQIFINICIRFKASNQIIRERTTKLIGMLIETFYFCEGDIYLKKFCQILYENLGEEYPQVLASILQALNNILQFLDIDKLQPPLEEFLPSLTPILKNRNEQVQLQLVNLIGKIASNDISADKVHPKEWIRICMDLLDLFNCKNKETRKQAINTFGFIARTIGPSDVLVTLINNLKVQDRQMRICTSVAIAVISETCGPFTVLPALMNEYRVPLNHVQNGILKTLNFIFEYIGEMSKDYIYSLVPLLEHALVSQDIVHKQIACNSLKNLSIGVFGYQCEQYLLHLFNFIFPNIFEKSPHVRNSVFEAFESLRLVIGPGEMFLFIVQGLFHAAKKVRQTYWSLYNILYISSQDSMIPFYIQFPENQKEISYNVRENYYLIQIIYYKIFNFLKNDQQ